MGWKQKEKELSVEEATALARKELEPYWIGGHPQIIGIQSGDHYVILPLDPEFPKVPWLVFCVDLTEFTSESIFYFAREWSRRYSSHGLRILIVLATRYAYLRLPEFTTKLRERKQLDFPITIDIQGTLFPAFGVSHSIKILLLRGSGRYFEHDQTTCFNKSETEIQHFLRSTDPGLSLLPILQPTQPILIDVARHEFGNQPQIGEMVTYISGEFETADSEGLRRGSFQNAKIKPLEENEFYLLGEWVQSAEFITTADPRAQLSFCIATSEFGIVAKAVHPTNSPRNDTNSIISVELNGESPHDAIMGTQLVLNETGESVVYIDQPGLYHILTGLPDTGTNEITLRFPNADKAPIELYGLRFGTIQ